MEVRGARSLDEVNLAYELAAKIYGPNYFDAQFNLTRVRDLEPLQNLEDLIVIADNHQILGMVRILDRELYSPAGIIKAGGITSVCVHPTLRGQGWGLRIMETALTRSSKRGDSISVLFARRAVDDWYPKLGYVGIGCHPELTLDESSASRLFPPSQASFRTGVVSENIAIYEQAYQSTYEKLFLSMMRTKKWWQTLDQRLAGRVVLSDFINVEIENSLIGYFILKEGRVIEAASLPKQQEELTSALMHYFFQQGEKDPILSLPTNHWCVDRLAVANHTLSVRYSWNGGHMARILDKEIFRKMVAQGATSETAKIVDQIFSRHDMTINSEAHSLLLSACGANKDSSVNVKAGQCNISPALIPHLPTWSAVDGL